MKTLKFAEPLPSLVLRGGKDTTWRLNDDKDISPNDKLSLLDNEKNEFGKAVVLWVKETTFGNLTEEDKEGHEKFSSEEVMKETYKKYYNQEISSETKLKVIKFKLI